MTGPDPGRGTSRALLVASVLTVLVVTAALAGLPFVRYAYRAPGLQIALHTADAVIALVVAYLVYGRYRQTSRVRDLLLASSLTVLATANLPFTALPQALAMQRDSELDQWAPLLVRTFGTVLFAAAALTPRSVRLDRRTARRAVLGVAAAALWLGGFGLVAADRLPPAVPADVLTDAADPLLVGHPVVLVLQGLGVVLYVSAAVAFNRGGRRERDEFLHWLAAAAVLAAGARINYLLFPSLYTDYLYTGDLLRLGFYLLLIVGAARELRSYWSGRLDTTLARGRRDALREVEDVVLQDLREAFRRSVEVAEAVRSGQAQAATQSCADALAALERALGEARREAEVAAWDAPFETQLRDAVAAAATRRSMDVHVQVDPAVDRPPHPDALLSIATEGVRGAGRHGGGSQARVTVSDNPLRLVVQDDGDAGDGARAAGFERIRRRAAQTGGAVTITAAPGRGTTITVDWL